MKDITTNKDLGLSAYIKYVVSIPTLSHDEENNLVTRWNTENCIISAQKLVQHHLKYVVKIAYTYKKYISVPFEEIISEGNIGLLKAVKDYKIEKGVRFCTYAKWWIEASIRDFIMRSWSIVKIPSSKIQRKLFYNFNQMRKTLGIASDDSLSSQNIIDIAKSLSVPENDVKDYYMYFNGGLSLDKETVDGATILDTIASSDESVESILINKEQSFLRNKALTDALSTLEQRDREIFIKRRLQESPLSLNDVGKQYGISSERVRQLEERAFKKVQKFLVDGFKTIENVA